MKKNIIINTIKAIGIWALIFFIILIIPDMFKALFDSTVLLKSVPIKALIAVVVSIIGYHIFLAFFTRKLMNKYKKFMKETRNGGLISESTKREMYEMYNKAVAENDNKTINDIITLLAEYYTIHGEAQSALQLLKGFNTAYYETSLGNIGSRCSLANYYRVYLHTLLILDDIYEADRIYEQASAILFEFLQENNDIGYANRVALTEYYLNKHDTEKAMQLLDECPEKLHKKHISSLTLLRSAALAELHRFDDAEALLNSIKHKRKEYLKNQIYALKSGTIQHIYDNTERNQTNEPLT